MQFATIFETVSDTVPDAPAIVHGDRRFTWASWDDASARFAAFLEDRGVGRDQKVALYLYNGPEYLIAQHAAFKQRAVPVNVNYRYLDDELAYLLDNSDAEILVYHASLADRVDRIRGRAANVRAFVEVDDTGPNGMPGATPPRPGALAWDEVLAGHDPAPRIARSPDDTYMLYTGGTTGMPKGVMYRMGAFTNGLLLGYPTRGHAIPAPEAPAIAAAVRAIHAAGTAPVSLPACPLMHGTGMWVGGFIQQLMGACVVLLQGRSFDPDELFRTATAEGADTTVIVGDAFARPMLRALDDAASRGAPYDLGRLSYLLSSGVMWSAEVKAGLLRHKAFTIIDFMGSSEGSMGNSVTTRDTLAGGGVATAKFTMNPTTKVFTDDDREVVPGSGEVGRVAAGGFVPVGYYKDPEKSARTFRRVGGVDYSFPGDMATVAEDGTLILLGRGSNCINTGGEKVYPEEVEEAVKRHPAVADCLVVGVPDERFGERVVAVAAPRAGSSVDPEELIAFTKAQLSGYKAPRQILVVAEVQRAPNGKADYGWAKQAAGAPPGAGHAPEERTE